MGFKRDTQIVWVDPQILREHPKNNNMHSPEQIEALAHSIRLNGETRAISVSTLSNCVVAGHCQLAASLYLGKELVPVVYIDFDTEDDEYFYMTADNTIAKESKIDMLGISHEFQSKGWGTVEMKRAGLKNFITDQKDKEKKKRECPECGAQI